jgi:hypothetical protein
MRASHVTKSTERIRTYMFDRGAEALARHLGPDAIEAYCCPLCVRVFTRAALASQDLTLEHVPPDAQGGRWALLTCKDCNNTAGGGVDSHATRSMRMNEIADALLRREGEAKGKGAVVLNGHRLKVRYDMTGDVFTLQPDGNEPHPRAPNHATYQDFWKGGTGLRPGHSMQFLPDQGYNDWLAQVGYLRTAYLAGCVKFGLEYALHPRLADVRAQLRNPTQKLIDGFMTFFDGSDRRRGFEMVTCEEPAATLLVRVGRRAALLPSLSGTAWTYPYPSGTTPESQRGSLHKCRPLDWPRRLEMQMDFREYVTPYKLDAESESAETSDNAPEGSREGRWITP